MMTRSLRPSFLTLLCLVLTATSAVAQERAAGTNPTSANADVTSQQTLSGDLKVTTANLAGTLNNNCTDAGVTYPHGTSWSTTCPAGTSGNMTKVCTHGQAVIASDSCKSALPCGTHQSGTSWSAACPSPMTGSMTYKCQDGNIVVDPTAFNSCHATNCTGATGSVACPTTADGILMSGSLTYQCDNNGNLGFTGSTCSTYNKPCGSVPHGGTTTAYCSSYNYNLGGNVNMTCVNGKDSVTGLNCHIRQWYPFSVTLGGAYSCRSSQGGVYNYESVKCAVGPFDLRAAINAQGGFPGDSDFSGVTVRVPYFKTLYHAAGAGKTVRSYALGDLKSGVYDASSEGNIYDGWTATTCSGTDQDRRKSSGGVFNYNGSTLRLVSFFASAGAEAGGRHFHPDCEGTAAVYAGTQVTGYVFR